MTRQGPERAIERLHPDFANRRAAAIAEARAAGLPLAGIFSAYRPPAFGVGGFADKFHSLHTYGLAVDVTGGAAAAHSYGLIAPAGLPAEVEAKLRKAAIKTLRSAELKKQFETQDALPSPSTPEEFTAFVKGERAKWEPVVTAVGIKLD